MSQYKNEVLKQKIRIEVEEWANEISDLHLHSLDSMWYETEESKLDKRPVVDRSYNSGRITRETADGKSYVLKKDDTAREIEDRFDRAMQNQRNRI
tara:strand:- start:365 stop:652 length:288 start_codon:yes stop_codon:yes gene_type:complete